MEDKSKEFLSYLKKAKLENLSHLRFHDLKDKELRTTLANTFHSYIVNNLPDEELLRFYVTGCGGENNDDQRKVAHAMEMRAKQSKKKPAFIILNGDNFYRSGVKSASDPLFKKNFTDVYEDPNFTETKDTPIFLGEGNHDYNAWGWGSKDNPESIEAFQVLFAYLINNQFSYELFQQFFDFQLFLSELRKYNFPSRNYTLFPKLAEIYMVDSTPIVREWLRSEKGKVFIKEKLNALYGEQPGKEYYAAYLKKIANNNKPNNAFDILCQHYKQSDVPIKILTCHHPIHYTADNREYDSDAKLYLNEDELALLKLLGIEGPYGDMIGQIFDIHGLIFQLVISAHVHSMYLYNDLKGKCQIVSGAGGAKLQHHRNFSDMKNLLLFVREHGFVEVVVARDKSMTFYFHSVENKMWVFKNYSQQPVRQFENRQITFFRETILRGVERYFSFLNEEQTKTNGSFLKIFGNGSHGDEGVDRANELRNYINQFHVENLKTIIDNVIKIIKKSADRYHSLKKKVNNEVEKTYRLSLEDLLACGNSRAILPFDLRKKKLHLQAKFFPAKTTDDLPRITALELDEKKEEKPPNPLMNF